MNTSIFLATRFLGKRLLGALGAMAFILCGGVEPSLQAQGLRYELGVRLRAFERQFESLESAAERGKALPDLEAAVSSFFGLQLQTAAKKLDQARLAVTPKQQQELLRRVINLQFDLPQRIWERPATEIAWSVKPFYAGDDWQGLTWSWELTPWHDPPVAAKPDGAAVVLAGSVVDLGDASQRQTVTQLDSLAEGDYRLQVWVADNEGQRLPVVETAVSVISQPAERIEALKTQWRLLPETLPASQRLSLKFNIQLLSQRWQNQGQEMDFPAAKVLRESEGALQALQQERSAYEAGETPRQYWMHLATATEPVYARLAVPPQDDSVSQRPVLILLHGAGGSENMFFDGYGDGKAVKMGLERGWLVVATRGNLRASLDELLDALDELYEVDRQRVLIIGHSMGAGQAIKLVSNAAKAPLAMAALGGGSRVREAEPFRKVALFAGAGEKDFGRGGVIGFRDSLQRQDVNVLYREWKQVEHLAIVQVALDDVFAFFDQTIKQMPLQR